MGITGKEHESTKDGKCILAAKIIVNLQDQWNLKVIYIYSKSIEKYNLRYVHYIGDGDTKSYKKVVGAKLYGDFTPQKLECVGHLQKRLGTRLRKIRNEKKHEILSDGKKISGKGRLTDKIINKMQNYYGMAIRQNPGQLHEMKKGIGAVLWHCSDIQDLEVRHQF